MIQRFEELDIPQEQKQMLVRLPYRVGLWVSKSDSTGGDDSNEQEIMALETVILTYGEDYCKSEFTQSLMEETIASYDDWAKWEENIRRVPEECKQAIYILGNEIGTKELGSFKESIFDIGETVALAYREIDAEHNLATNIKVQIRILQKKWQAFRYQYPFSLDHALNISPAEELALGELKIALRA